jgi:hypothetical protein
MLWFKKKKEIKEVEKDSCIFTINVKIHPERKMEEVEYEWDEQFVEYLRKNGFSGTSDELVVKKWLQTLVVKLGEKLFDKSKVTSEYE